MKFLDLSLTLLSLLLPVLFGVLVLYWNNKKLNSGKENLWIALVIAIVFQFQTLGEIIEHFFHTIQDLIFYTQQTDSEVKLFHFPAASILFFSVLRILMIWIALGYLIDRSGFKKKEKVSLNRRFIRKNILTISTIIVAFYLAITALITAPIVRGEGVNANSNFYQDLSEELKETESFDNYQLDRFDSLLSLREKQAELLPKLSYWGSMIAYQIRDSLRSSQEDMSSKNLDSITDMVFKTKLMELNTVLQQNKRESVASGQALDQSKFMMYVDYLQSGQKVGELFPQDLMGFIDQEFTQLNTLKNLVQSRSLAMKADVRDFVNQFLYMQRHMAIQQMQEAEKANLVNNLKLRHKAALYDWYVAIRSERFDYFITQIDCTRDVIYNFSSAIIPEGDLDNALEYSYLKNYHENQSNRKKFGTAGFFISFTDGKLDSAISEYYRDSSQFLINKLQENSHIYSDRYKQLDSILTASTLQWDSLLQTPPELAMIPPIPEQGENLGIFSAIMGWLLRIQDYSVVLIVGLIGFGLMGAAGATFIKEASEKEVITEIAEEKKKESEKTSVTLQETLTEMKKPDQMDEEDLLVKDLPGVIIKGFTAALIVFLGFQGGMTLLTGSGSTPPDESLFFFLALAASVYSDTTWNWAKVKLRSTLDKTNQSSAPPDGQVQQGAAGTDNSVNNELSDDSDITETNSDPDPPK